MWGSPLHRFLSSSSRAEALQTTLVATARRAFSQFLSAAQAQQLRVQAPLGPFSLSAAAALRPLAPSSHALNPPVGLRAFASGAVAAAPGPRSGSSGAASERSWWAKALLLLPPLTAAMLGKWQLDRRQWKIELLERRKEKMEEDPIDIFSDEMPAPEEYQRVKATGIFDYSRTQYVGPRPRSKMGETTTGFLAVTPLTEESQKGKKARTVMVLRGWIPHDWRSNDAARAKGEPGGVQTVEGLIRFSEDPGNFVPDNNPEAGTWYYINPEELAVAAGLPEGTPLLEIVSSELETKMMDAGPSAMEVLGGRGRAGPAAPQEEYPLAKSAGDMGTFRVMPIDHMNYAATWFALSAATALLATQALRKKAPRGGPRR